MAASLKPKYTPTSFTVPITDVTNMGMGVVVANASNTVPAQSFVTSNVLNYVLLVTGDNTFEFQAVPPSANITVTDAASDTTTWLVLAGSQTGNTPALSDAGLTYNAASNALTVAGQVVPNGGIASTAGLTGPISFTGANTSFSVGSFANTGGTFYFGVEASVGGTLVTGTTAYASIFGTPAALPTHIFSNNIVTLTSKSDGTGITVPGTLGVTGLLSADAGVAAPLPPSSHSADYTFVLADKSGFPHIHDSADNNPRTFTIPANASVAFPLGTVIPIINGINTLTIAITSDTLTWLGVGSTGTRTITNTGAATLFKYAATKWYISGVGLS